MTKPRFRCSELDRLITCHGSRSIDSKFARISKDSVVSLAGTKIHALGAVQLISAGAIGTAEDPSPTLELDDTELWIVDFWVAAVLELVPDGWAIEVESEMEAEFLRFILTGHLDVLAISPDGTEAIIIDLKTGYIAVDPAECNWQLAGYATLLRVVMPGIKKARLVIVQPRNNEDLGEKRISESDIDFTRTDIEALMATELGAVLNDPYTFTTSKKGCLYCDWLLVCPCIIALRKTMKLQLTADQFDAIPSEPTIAQLGEWVRDGKILDKPIETARETIKERLGAAKTDLTLEDGTRIYVEDGQGPRTVSNVTTLLMRVGLVVPDQKKVHAFLKPSLDLIEKTVAAELKIPISSKDQLKMSGKKWVSTNLGDLITRKPTKTLVIA